VSASVLDVWLMAAFGLAGYLLRKLGFDVAPLLLAVVLGDRIEVALRRALTISNGDYWILVHSAFSKIFVGAVLVLVALQGIAWYFGFSRKAVRAAQA
jgi:putative tricarboxylic transport membrane protein